jgi:hypothetical protein
MPLPREATFLWWEWLPAAKNNVQLHPLLRVLRFTPLFQKVIGKRNGERMNKTIEPLNTGNIIKLAT